MSDLQPRRQALPVMLLVKTSLQFLWQQRDDALRLGLLPTLLLFASLLYGADGIVALAQTAQLAQSGAPAEIPPEAMPRLLALSAGLYVAVAWLTVNWLRFLLLGPMGAVGLGLNIGGPHIRFLVALVALSLLASAVLMTLMLPLTRLPAMLALVGQLVLVAAVILVVVRLVPYFVGIAIGQPLSFAQSWKVSRGNALSLAVSLFLVQVPFMIAFYVLQMVMVGTGFLAGAPIGSAFVMTVVHVASSLCQAGVLATAYRHLVGVRV